MRASHNLSTVSVSCDEPNLVSGAGLLPAAVLAQKIGLSELIDQRVRLAAHGANSGTKALPVIGSMLLGGDSVTDAALLQAGATSELFDQSTPYPPSTEGPRRSRPTGGAVMANSDSETARPNPGPLLINNFVQRCIRVKDVD